MAAQASASTELLRDEARSLTASVADFVQTGVEAEAQFVRDEAVEAAVERAA